MWAKGDAFGGAAPWLSSLVHRSGKQGGVGQPSTTTTVIDSLVGMEFKIGALRTLAFVVIVFGNQATTYAIRERRRLWSSRPYISCASSVVDLLIASTLAVGGNLHADKR